MSDVVGLDTLTAWSAEIENATTNLHPFRFTDLHCYAPSSCRSSLRVGQAALLPGLQAVRIGPITVSYATWKRMRGDGRDDVISETAPLGRGHPPSPGRNAGAGLVFPLIR